MASGKWLVLLSGIALQAGGANLSPQTAKAWEDYVGSVRAQTQARLGASACFLWAEEDPMRLARVRAGEIWASPADGPMPRRIPGGLIHHWIGAVFLPGVTLSEVLAVSRDYIRYPQYYPSVVNSRLLARYGATDDFATLERHQAMFSRIAFDGEFTTTYADAGTGRAYSVSSARRLRQVQNYGSRGQAELEPYASKAYLWSLSTISRYWERDGGVYVELEAMGLSRDIPAGLRWIVDPFVRKAAEDALIADLQQTRRAVLESRSVPKPPIGALTFEAP